MWTDWVVIILTRRVNRDLLIFITNITIIFIIIIIIIVIVDICPWLKLRSINHMILIILSYFLLRWFLYICIFLFVCTIFLFHIRLMLLLWCWTLYYLFLGLFLYLMFFITSMIEYFYSSFLCSCSSCSVCLDCLWFHLFW